VKQPKTRSNLKLCSKKSQNIVKNQYVHTLYMHHSRKSPRIEKPALGAGFCF